MENLFLTSLTTPEVRELFRQELQNYFENQNLPVTSKSEPPITTKQLCEFLGVTEPTIIRWRKKGKIPFMQIGSALRYDKEAVIKAISEKKKGGTQK
ncbi:helix-turn-helix domain-containing protein [Pedobacter sp.]|jgi:excisionase family DNA binding protein|uniref:helix-turn-helix domain-containing protein n=1 Tax=Pedobacter sp. TaxID=1411316 RepID=UPI002C98718E|nr:helix-turn-helix domain-containing protein [Pedobacter sp.]HWW39358.1 helix-turn-helix domain-containing protein [Pedobacter sp.]